MTSLAAREAEALTPGTIAPRGNALLARYAYHAEQTAQSLRGFAGQGLVLELVPALGINTQSD